MLPFGIGLDSIYRLAFQTGRFGNRRNRHSLTQKLTDQRELMPRERRLASPILSSTVIARSGVSNAGFLCFFGNFGLRLCHCRHEGDQGIPNGLRHGVAGRAIKGQAIDDSPNDDATPNKFADGLRPRYFLPQSSRNWA